ncbi:MAG: carbohydrate kinase, partial [Chloroflexi bacterium]|nr:carbohydrate kinase [Chloroflexota bacterium]
MAAYLLGMDYGTGGAKACLINTEGEVLGFSFEEYPFIHQHPGWSEHDANLYWPIACRLIQQVMAQAGAAPREVRGVAVSSALPSLVLVDRAGRPLANAYNLMDRRATEEVAWLRREFGEDYLFQISGNRLEDHPTLVNLIWEMRHRPETFRQVDKALTIDGYITRRLTGVSALHHSGAGFYGPAYNLRERRYQADLLEAIGIPLEMMPPLYDCTDIVGEITPEAATETG